MKPIFPVSPACTWLCPVLSKELLDKPRMPSSSDWCFCPLSQNSHKTTSIFLMLVHAHSFICSPLTAGIGICTTVCMRVCTLVQLVTSPVHIGERYCFITAPTQSCGSDFSLILVSVLSNILLFLVKMAPVASFGKENEEYLSHCGTKCESIYTVYYFLIYWIQLDIINVV